MSKKDIKKSVDEMIRVLKPGGLCFVKLFSKDSEHYGEGEEPNPGECVEIYDDEIVMHTFFDDEEPDKLFENLEIEVLYKEKRVFAKNLKIEYLKKVIMIILFKRKEFEIIK